jgi:hypothetical protein
MAFATTLAVLELNGVRSHLLEFRSIQSFPSFLYLFPTVWFEIGSAIGRIGNG